jgi:hypothetical protein
MKEESTALDTERRYEEERGDSKERQRRRDKEKMKDGTGK